MDERDIRQPDETEDVAQIRFLVVVLLGRSAGAESAATRSEDHYLLSLQNSFCTSGAVKDRAADTDDLIDPGLQGSGNRQVVHGGADHNRVSSQQLFDQRLGNGESLPLRGSQAGWVGV